MPRTSLTDETPAGGPTRSVTFDAARGFKTEGALPDGFGRCETISLGLRRSRLRASEALQRRQPPHNQVGRRLHIGPANVPWQETRHETSRTHVARFGSTPSLIDVVNVHLRRNRFAMTVLLVLSLGQRDRVGLLFASFGGRVSRADEHANDASTRPIRRRSRSRSR